MQKTLYQADCTDRLFCIRNKINSDFCCNSIIKSNEDINRYLRCFFGVLGMRNNLAVKVRYRLGSRNC